MVLVNEKASSGGGTSLGTKHLVLLAVVEVRPDELGASGPSAPPTTARPTIKSETATWVGRVMNTSDGQQSALVQLVQPSCDRGRMGCVPSLRLPARGRQ